MKVRIESLGEVLLEADAVDEPKKGDRITINDIKYEVAMIYSEFASHDDIPSLSKTAVVARVVRVGAYGTSMVVDVINGMEVKAQIK